MEDLKMRTEEPTLNEALCQSRDEFFFRHSDVVRFHRAFETLVSDANHLLITSPFEGVIEHYSKMMLNRCAMRSGLIVETLMPSSTEALVDRFNEFVSNVSVDDARKYQQSEQGRIIVINDIKFIEAESWPLLVRMTNDFPGLNIRLLILLDNLSSSSERVLDRIGSKLMRWDVETPNAEEQTSLRAAAMKAGVEFQVERVLSRINSKMLGVLEPNLDSVSASDSGKTGNAAGEKEAEDMRALFDSEHKSPRKSRFIPIFLGLVITSALGAYVYRDHPLTAKMLEQYSILNAAIIVEERIKDTKQSVVDAAYSVVTEKRVSDGKQSEKNSPLENPTISKNSTQGQSTLEFPKQILEKLAVSQINAGNSAQESDNVEDASTDRVAQSMAENAGEAPENSSETDNIREPTQIDTTRDSNPSAILQVNIQTVQIAAPSAQFIQHLVSAEEISAREWLSTQSGLTKSMIVPVDLGEQLKFAVVSGPFANQDEIEKYIQAMPADADYWVRSGESLAKVLDTD